MLVPITVSVDGILRLEFLINVRQQSVQFMVKAHWGGQQYPGQKYEK